MPEAGITADRLWLPAAWETVRPAAGNATPMTYQIGGQQFVVIVAGGGKRGGESGGKYVAFALPHNKCAWRNM